MKMRDWVLQSINHKKPFRLALDLGGTPGSGVPAIGRNKLKAALGINGRANKGHDVVRQVTQPEENMLAMYRAVKEY